MPKYFYIFVVFSFLVGCGSSPRKVEYNPQGVPQEKLASIVSTGHYEEGGHTYYASIAGVYDENGKRVAGYEMFSGYPKEVTIPEGKYTLQVRCAFGISTEFYNYHAFTILAKQNEQYYAYCIAKRQEGFLGFEVTRGLFGFVSKRDNYERERSEYKAKIDALPPLE